MQMMSFNPEEAKNELSSSDGFILDLFFNLRSKIKITKCKFKKKNNVYYVNQICLQANKRKTLLCGSLFILTF